MIFGEHQDNPTENNENTEESELVGLGENQVESNENINEALCAALEKVSAGKILDVLLSLGQSGGKILGGGRRSSLEYSIQRTEQATRHDEIFRKEEFSSLDEPREKKREFEDLLMSIYDIIADESRLANLERQYRKIEKSGDKEKIDTLQVPANQMRQLLEDRRIVLKDTISRFDFGDASEWQVQGALKRLKSMPL